jgi:1,4-alpha-glucan branching enzyme
MRGYLCLVLHAHLPFVRHPEHDRFLEEHWLYEAMTECYLPLLQLLEKWQKAGLAARVTFSLTPTLCAMLRDPLLQRRYQRYLDEMIELAEKELYRTSWEPRLRPLAEFYLERFLATRETYRGWGGDVVHAFRHHQDEGRIEIITSAATHALLPLLANHPPSVRAQIHTAREDYRRCFGRDPEGIWLPECAYYEGLEEVLKEAGLRWFITETHGLLNARPRPRYGPFAPVYTRAGVAAFARDQACARQVWSRDEGYPGDARYRDFYRDIGFDLDLDYLRPHLVVSELRSFTGIKYHRITGGSGPKALYERGAALAAINEHATHFLASRVEQVQKLGGFFDRPPAIVAPYDAELFGHWWFEGPEFLDAWVRKTCLDQQIVRLITPGDYLREHPTNQVATPAASSWGEEGYWRVWLNEKNEWVFRQLSSAQVQMTALVRQFPKPAPLQHRALQQAGRELLLAQASDWPFILHTGTSPEYARRRVSDHLRHFDRLREELTQGQIDETALASLEARDNLFPDLDYSHWA